MAEKEKEMKSESNDLDGDEIEIAPNDTDEIGDVKNASILIVNDSAGNLYPGSQSAKGFPLKAGESISYKNYPNNTLNVHNPQSVNAIYRYQVLSSGEVEF